MFDTVTKAAFWLTMIIVNPVLTIWALNLLFGLAIPLTIWTWLAVTWLTVLLQPFDTGDVNNFFIEEKESESE